MLEKVENEIDNNWLPDTKEALFFIQNAWKKVSESTIKNCWRHCGYQWGHEESDVAVKEDKIEIKDLQIKISALEKLKKFQYVSAEEYIEVDNDKQTCEALSDEAIVKLVTNKEADNEKIEVEDSEPEPVVISSNEASKFANDLRIFFEQANNLEALACIDNTIKPAIEQFISHKKKQSTLNDFITKNN